MIRVYRVLHTAHCLLGQLMGHGLQARLLQRARRPPLYGKRAFLLEQGPSTFPLRRKLCWAPGAGAARRFLNTPVQSKDKMPRTSNINLWPENNCLYRKN